MVWRTPRTRALVDDRDAGDEGNKGDKGVALAASNGSQAPLTAPPHPVAWYGAGHRMSVVLVSMHGGFPSQSGAIPFPSFCCKSGNSAVNRIGAVFGLESTGWSS